MKTIGHYTLKEELGRGGAGVVYRAHDPRLDRDVAIKVLKDRGQEQLDQRDRRRFLTEARALAKLRHPNVITIYDVGLEEGRLFIAMDLVEGSSLEERILNEGPLPPRRALTIAAKLARALHYAHGESLLHRDVKPANVLLTAAGEPLLTDFGLAKRLDAQGGLSWTGGMLGTPGFMPPEQAEGKSERMGPHSDVYALGATLYAMLTGQPPFMGSLPEVMVSTVSQMPAPPSELNPAVDAAVDALCLRCLAKEPEDRYASAWVAAEAFDAQLETSTLGTTPIPPAPVAAEDRPAGQVAVWLLSGAVVLLVVLTAFIVALQSQSERADEAEAAAQEAAGRASAAESRAEVAEAALAAWEAKLAAIRAAAGAGSTAAAIDPPLASGTARARARRHFQQAGMRLLGDDHRGAVVEFSNALQADPSHAPSWHGRGFAHVELGKPVAAVADLNRAITLNPRNAESFVQRGRAWGLQGNFRGMILDCSRALAIDPKHTDALLKRGWARQSLQDARGAIADFGRLHSLATTPSLKGQALNNRALANLQLGRTEKARRDLARAIQLRPSDALPLCNRGLLEALSGSRVKALRTFRQAATLDPDSLRPRLWIAGLGGERAGLERGGGAPWPKAIAAVYLERKTPAQLLREAELPRGQAQRARRLCQAHGFLGLRAELRQETGKARRHYQACRDTGVINYTIYFWATGRLRQLQGD